mmetsp:Transcript_7546/g.21627  ORF Transcript_7546/g.21627 Transcript_7546/m.21627 type:complete len:219 (+) Transcript_7546:2544-3200(+)
MSSMSERPSYKSVVSESSLRCNGASVSKPFINTISIRTSTEGAHLGTSTSFRASLCWARGASICNTAPSIKSTSPTRWTKFTNNCRIRPASSSTLHKCDLASECDHGPKGINCKCGTNTGTCRQRLNSKNVKQATPTSHAVHAEMIMWPHGTVSPSRMRNKCGPSTSPETEPAPSTMGSSPWPWSSVGGCLPLPRSPNGINHARQPSRAPKPARRARS